MPEPRLYTDLAWLWPHLSPPEHYTAEAAHLDALLKEHLGPEPQRILEMGAGGGHTLFHLDQRTGGRHHTTAADLSEPMLAHCRQLIPGIATHAGDMRTMRLDQTFDAVFIHDAIDYLLTEDDLTRTFETAKAHLRPGGLLFVAPTYLTETFEDGDVADDGTQIDDDQLTYFSYVHDPNPDDTTFEMILLYLIRKSSPPNTPRSVQVIEDRHTCGLFPIETWQRRIVNAGFTLEPVEDAEDAAWELFLGRA
ncbi:MAG: class I SAM-dependent methyltransferase [Algisphaera sp.]